MSSLDYVENDSEFFNPEQEADSALQATLNKAYHMSSNFYKRFRDKLDIQQLFSCQHHSWLLNQSELKTNFNAPLGLASETKLTDSYNEFLLLVPQKEDYPHLDFREVHQIVRELTIGMFVFNQTPNISLLSNFDKSTSVSMSSPYVDTLIGQALAAVDYELKTIWHGSHFDNKESRQKFNDRWRTLVHLTAAGVPREKLDFQKIFTTPSESTGNGIKDKSSVPVYEHLYDNPPVCTDDDMKLFMEHEESYLMYGKMRVSKVETFKNLILTTPVFDVNTIVEDPDMSFEVYNQIQSRLRHQAEVSQIALAKRLEIRRHLMYLDLVASLIPLFTALKKSGKIIDLNRLLSITNFGSSDEMRTDKEFPPHILGKNFKCKHFNFKDDYFGLNGRMGFDPETKPVENSEDKLSSSYEDLMKKAKKNLDELLENTNIYADSYPVPVHTVNEQYVNLILLETEPFSTANGTVKPIWVQIMLEEKAKKKKVPTATLR